MKPDRYGTPAGRYAYHIGYLSPAERKACGRPDERTCASCHWSMRETYTTGWGGIRSRIRCLHRHVPSEKGLVTKDNAVCDEWQPRHF